MTTTWKRRALLGGGALAATATGLGAFAYSRFGGFMRQFAREAKIPVNPPPKIPDPKTWPDKGIHSAWLGHSTVLLKIDGYTILTDPVFGNRCGLDFYLFTIGLKRIVAPAIALDEIPPVDLILSSHAHMDHLDTASMRALESKNTTVIMATSTKDIIRPTRYHHVAELNWNQSHQAGPAAVRAVEVNHWGARMRTDTYRGYNGYTIEINNRRILFAGDTALTTTFRNVRSQREFDLAIMPIGAYNPWIRFHCTPEQAVRMANEAGAAHVLPVHHQTFRLGQEPFLEPIQRFHDAIGPRTDRIGWHTIGEEFHLS